MAKSITISPVAADPDGIAQSQTPGAAGNLTINGALASGGVATIPQPAHVTIASAGNDSARTFTVTGTDRYGNAITESITGPNATTVTGTKNFATVTQVAIDAAAAGAITVGNAASLESQWIVWDSNLPQHSGQVDLSASASMTWELQRTNADVFASGFDETDDAAATADATQTGKTADGFFYLAGVPVASRIKITSFVSGTAKFLWHETR